MTVIIPTQLGASGRPIDEEEDEISSCIHCGWIDALHSVPGDDGGPPVVFCDRCKQAAYIIVLMCEACSSPLDDGGECPDGCVAENAEV